MRNLTHRAGHTSNLGLCGRGSPVCRVHPNADPIVAAAPLFRGSSAAVTAGLSMPRDRCQATSSGHRMSRPERLPTQAPDRAGRAQLRHPAPQTTDSLGDPGRVDRDRRRQWHHSFARPAAGVVTHMSKVRSRCRVRANRAALHVRCLSWLRTSQAAISLRV